MAARLGPGIDFQLTGQIMEKEHAAALASVNGPEWTSAALRFTSEFFSDVFDDIGDAFDDAFSGW